MAAAKKKMRRGLLKSPHSILFLLRNAHDFGIRVDVEYSLYFFTCGGEKDICSHSLAR